METHGAQGHDQSMVVEPKVPLQESAACQPVNGWSPPHGVKEYTGFRVHCSTLR